MRSRMYPSWFESPVPSGMGEPVCSLGECKGKSYANTGMTQLNSLAADPGLVEFQTLAG